jgi:hypothetical protein
VQRGDEPRILGIVAQRLTQLADASRQHIVTDKTLRPHRRQQRLLAHYLAGAREEEIEHRR